MLEVSQNAGTPKSFILIGLSIDHPAIEVPSIDGNLPKTATLRMEFGEIMALPQWSGFWFGSSKS